jgi:hypothetical protein
MKEAVVIGAYTDTIEKELTLVKTILDWKKYNIPIILTTHYPISERIQNLVNYYIFDKNQYLDNSFKWQREYGCESFKIIANASIPYHGVAALIATQNAIRSIGDKFDFMYLQDYDINLNKSELFKIIRPLQDSKFEIFMFNWNIHQDSYAGSVSFVKQGAFNKIWGDIQSVNDYRNLMTLVNKNEKLIEYLTKYIVHTKNLQDIVYVFNKEQTEILLNNILDVHFKEPITPKIFLSSTTDNKTILFLINPTPESIFFEIQTKNNITNQQENGTIEVAGNMGMYWRTYDNNIYLKISYKDIEKEYNILPDKVFTDCRFYFTDNTQIFMKDDNIFK